MHVHKRPWLHWSVQLSLTIFAEVRQHCRICRLSQTVFWMCALLQKRNCLQEQGNYFEACFDRACNVVVLPIVPDWCRKTNRLNTLTFAEHVNTQKWFHPRTLHLPHQELARMGVFGLLVNNVFRRKNSKTCCSFIPSASFFFSFFSLHFTRGVAISKTHINSAKYTSSFLAAILASCRCPGTPSSERVRAKVKSSAHSKMNVSPSNFSHL